MLGNNERKDGFELTGSVVENFDDNPSSHLAPSKIAAPKDEPDDWMAAWTAEIVLAYLAMNTISSGELPRLIANLKQVLREISEKNPPLKNGIRPAVPIAQSITPDYIVCLEDGRRFKSMKRYIKSAYDLTPNEYRDKWGLPNTYPMIAPNYSKLCSDRARRLGLGKRDRPGR